MDDVIVISSLTKEYVRVPVSAKEQGVVVNPTALGVEMSCPVVGVEPSAWVTATWETETPPSPQSPIYYARATVGGTGSSIVLADGRYDVWIRITAGVETPVKKCGTLIVT